MSDDPRTVQLRAWAAWDYHAKDEYGTDEAARARAEADLIADRLGDFTDADLLIIDAARRRYIEDES